jgi:hypothetical protein
LLVWVIDLIAVEVDLTPKSIVEGSGISIFVQPANTIKTNAIIVFFILEIFISC